MNISLKSNIWKFYLIKALGIYFIAPIRIIYLISFGLTFSQIGMMELAAAIAVIVLEIPSGIYADMFGRKKSRLIAYLLSFLAFSCLSFGSTPAIFIFGWALSGAADAFQSGAQDALIFDTLKQLNREKEYIKMKSHFLLINTLSVVIGSLVGSYVYLIDRRLPWYMVIVTIVASAILFLSIKEPKFTSKFTNFNEHFANFKKSLIFSLSKIEVKRLLVFGIILALPMYVFTTLLSQPYLISRGFNIQSLGIIFSIITGAGGLIASLTHKVEPFLKQKLSFALIIISFTFLLIGMGIIHSPFVLILLIAFYIIDNFKNVIIDNYLNESISSESRATVLSVQSFVNNILISILFVFVGYLVDIFSIDFVLISLGALVFIVCTPLFVLGKSK